MKADTWELPRGWSVDECRQLAAHLDANGSRLAAAVDDAERRYTNIGSAERLVLVQLRDEAALMLAGAVQLRRNATYRESTQH